MTGLEAVLLALAAYRWARLIAVDEIALPLRRTVVRWSTRPPRSARRAAGRLGLAVPDRDPGWRRHFVYLVGCPHCLAVWSSAGLVAVWEWAPPWGLLWLAVVVVPAVAAVTSLLVVALPPE